MHLPGLSGLEVSAKIRKNPISSNFKTPIIALTASVRPSDIQDYITAELQDVVAKPVKQQLLFKAIARAIDPQKSKLFNPTSQKNTTSEPPLMDQSMIETHLQILGPAKLVKLLQNFCHTQQKLWPILQKSLVSNDYYEIENQAHELAGACDMMGFSRSSELLRQLEYNAKKGAVEARPELILQLDLMMTQNLTIASTYFNLTDLSM
jgi:two-component system sensor histidine kinase TorS